MINPALFDIDDLLQTLLQTREFSTRWRRDAEIIPAYLAPFAKENEPPRCVVRHGTLFLRHSKGPHQGHSWDSYGDDYMYPSLALVALMMAPPPPPVMKPRNIFTVSQTEVSKWGCPSCGYRSGSMPISGGDCGMWSCAECDDTCFILADGVTKATMSFNDQYPELQDHPRRGTPSHGRADKRPPGGGEFFRCRPVGMDTTPGCFICGGEKGMRSNIAAYVQTKEAGERVVKMFERGAFLDFRDFEPDYLQVKFGACKKHVMALEMLQALTRDGVLTAEKLAHVRADEKISVKRMEMET